MKKYNLLCESLFKDTLKDVRKKGKDIIYKMSKDAVEDMGKTLRKDLESKYTVSQLDIKLGRFRGISFITSCKLSIKPKGGEVTDEAQVETLLKYLQDKYSPKFKLKSISNGEAHFNVR